MQIHLVCPDCNALNRLAAARLGDRPVCGGCQKPLFTAQPLELRAENFERHSTRNDIPLLVDFWAPWCGPCRTMAPAFIQAAERLEPKYRLAKVNTEAQPELAGRFSIRSIPTLALFLHGRELGRQAGAMPATAIVQWVMSTHAA